ncbi:MAG: hypothetical protein DRG11_04605 [Epsilonproteobacteria bacterium]|nr:MAG: hypothetical protein DRG11_04605 [Campylobacterota bacterium]
MNIDGLYTHDKMSLRQVVINYIYQAIIDKKYKPREHITETSLSNKLSISRAPVREALSELVAVGILIKVDRVGIFLNTITPAQVLDTYHTKGLVEGYLSNDFMREHDKEDIILLENIVTNMKQDILNDGENQIDIGTKFHKSVLKYSYNKVLLNTLDQVNIKSKLLFFENWSKLYSKQNIIDRHQVIIDSIKSKNAKKVERAIRDHYIQTGKKIAKLVEKNI